MCGIIGYIGKRQAQPLLLEGLKALEYRGYDSAGIALVGFTAALPVLYRLRKSGKITNLETSAQNVNLHGTLGIGHTRWATHGEPYERNAHPHLSRLGNVAVVHNGIIENHEILRAQLCKEGFNFSSETDTEVLPHLIERELQKGAGSLHETVASALAQVEGAYAIAVISSHYPTELVAACNSSPLVIGIGKEELYLASDELAFAGKVRGVVHVRDGEIVTLKQDGSYFFHNASVHDVRSRIEVPGTAEAVNKGGYPHYMLKEIHEQPQAIRSMLSHLKGKEVSFGGLTADIEARLANTRRIILAGCGTSLFAASAGKLFIEQLAGIPCEAEQAAEFSYRNPALSSLDTLVGISQSGETADTLRAVELGQERHALCMSITNRVGSTLARRTKLGMYLHAGPEISVASTKAFTSQVVMLLLFALRLAQVRGKVLPEQLLRHMLLLPPFMIDTLAREGEMRALARQYAAAKRIIVIGRGSTTALAYEAALKIRELSYIDAHGLSAAELKHGTLALVEPGVPVVALMPQGTLHKKMSSNLEEIKARGGEVVILESDQGLCDELTPILLAPLVQLFAYSLGVERGVDVDQPRNLAKSVTVE